MPWYGTRDGIEEKLPLHMLTVPWQPTLWNFKKDARGKPIRGKNGEYEKTSPKMQEAGKLCVNLEELNGELVRSVVRWLSLRNRLSVVSGWLANPRLALDGYLSAGAAGITNTHRMKHTCVVNLPKAEDSVTLGKEVRSLFIARPGNVLVGYDALAIENRMEAHYVYPYPGGPEYAIEILEGDPHKKNAFVFYEAQLAEKGLYPDTTDKDTPAFKPFRSKSKNGKYCVPMDTYCLVKTKGWCAYDEVHEGDMVLGYDPETKTKKWTEVTGKVFFPHEEVVELKNRWFCIRSTEDHRWFVKQRKETSNSVRTAVDEIRLTRELNTESNIIVNAPMDTEYDTTNSNTGLAASKYHTNWVLRVLQMSQAERKAWLEGFLIADGHYSSNGWNWGQLRNHLAEAALIASYLVHDGTIQCSVNGTMMVGKLTKKSHRGLQTAKRTVLPRQPVWCLQTRLGSWVMRQGNVITITGNCLSYGGSGSKLAKTLGLPESEGDRLYDAFWNANLPLKLFREKLTLFWETTGGKKRLKGIDGRWLMTRSKHSLVNTVFQNAGGTVMDYSLMFMDKWLGGLTVDSEGKPCYTYKGYPLYRVAYMHDEALWDVPPAIADEIALMGPKSIEAAGRYLKFRVALGGEAKIGPTWASVH